MRALAAATAVSKLTRNRLKLRNHWIFTFGENILNTFSTSSRCDSLVKTSECMLVTKMNEKMENPLIKTFRMKNNEFEIPTETGIDKA